MNKRLWTKECLEKAIRESRSYRQVLCKIGLKEAGGNYVQLKKYIKEYNFDISHFKGRGWSKGLHFKFSPKIPLKKILVKNSSFQSYKLKNRLIREKLKPSHCEECGWAEISENGRLPLELHHIDGDSKNNSLENLEILCPNCHSLKSNYRGRKKPR